MLCILRILYILSRSLYYKCWQNGLPADSISDRPTGGEQQMSDQQDRDRLRPNRGCWIFAAVVVLLFVALGAAVYLHDYSLRRKFEAKVESVRAQGQPVTFAEILALRDTMPDEENSALVFMDALRLLEDTRRPEDAPLELALSQTKTLGVTHSDQVREMERAYLESWADALEIIYEGAKLRGGVYPLQPAEQPYAILMPYLGSLMSAARLCALEAALRAESGDGGGAAESIVAGRRLASSLDHWPLFIEALVRFATDRIMLDGLERSLALCEMQPEQLRRLREELAEEAEQLSLEPAFLAERAAAHYIFAEATSKELAAAFGGDDSRLKLRFKLYALLPGQQARDALFFYEIMDECLATCALPARQRLQESARASQALEERMADEGRRCPISAMIMPALYGIFEEGAKTEVSLQLARTALAVEEWRQQHGRWPDSLEQLAPDLLEAVPEDPFSDGAIRYLRTEGGVVLYSVGPDGTDEQGLSREEAERAAEGSWNATPASDLPFRLLDPERRGAKTYTFHDEIMDSSLDLETLEVFGFGTVELEKLGFSVEDIETLGYR